MYSNLISPNKAHPNLKKCATSHLGDLRASDCPSVLATLPFPDTAMMTVNATSKDVNG